MSSALLTPTDLSPARPFDIKLHSPYEPIPSGNVYHSQSSLLLDNNFPVKSQEALAPNLVPSRTPLVQLNHPRHQAPINTFPYFETVSEPLATNSLMQINPISPHSTLYNTPLPPRRMDARLPTLEWRMSPQQHQIRQPSLHVDRRLGVDQAVPDYATSGVGGGTGQEEPLRSSFGHQQSTAAQSLQTSHEVRIF